MGKFLYRSGNGKDEISNNPLKEFFDSHETGRGIWRWNHYFDIYERHFNKFRNKEIVVLEIGVAHGGSLQMWKEYFGDKAKIYGIDINPKCKEFEEENIEIFIGSQSDKKFLQKVKSNFDNHAFSLAMLIKV